MKIVLQRVIGASVEINGVLHSKINNGVCLLFGVEKYDKREFIAPLAQKVLNLRIFSDENHKMNLSLTDIKGEILVVSQFTLAADCKKGLRPSFDNAMEPKIANDFYEEFISHLKKSGLVVHTGVFGADMKVSIINNGPVTFILEKKNEKDCCNNK